MRTVDSGRVRRRLGGALAAILLLLTGCADASGLADSGGTATEEPTATPSQEVTDDPTDNPTDDPTDDPTDGPTDEPTDPPVSPVERPGAGDCMTLTGDDVLLDVLTEVPELRPCGSGHTAQVASVEPLVGRARAAAASGDLGPVTDQVVNRCRDRVASWLGTDLEGLAISQFFALPAFPSPEQVEAGADFYTCTTFVVERGTELMQLPRDTQGLMGTDRGVADFGTCARAAISNAGDDRLVCSIKHNWRAVSAVRLGGPGAPFPGDNNARDRVQGTCEDDVGDYVDATGTYDYGYTWPTRTLWSEGDRYGICYAKVDF